MRFPILRSGLVERLTWLALVAVLTISFYRLMQLQTPDVSSTILEKSILSIMQRDDALVTLQARLENLRAQQATLAADDLQRTELGRRMEDVQRAINQRTAALRPQVEMYIRKQLKQ